MLRGPLGSKGGAFWVEVTLDVGFLLSLTFRALLHAHTAA